MWRFRSGCPVRPAGQKVLLLIDWDNFRSGLQTRFGSGKIFLEQRIRRLETWVRGELGELWGDHGFVFAHEYLNEAFKKMCVRNSLRTFTCPKRDTPDSNGSMDSVDEILIWFGENMLNHPDVGFLCIVSGDKHYIPLMEKANKAGVRVAFVVPSVTCFSKTPETIAKMMRLTGVHPVTEKKMFVRLDELDIAE